MTKVAFVKRGKRITEFSVQWRTECGNYAVRESKVPGYPTRYYAMVKTMDGWASIEHKDGQVKTYRKRTAAVKVIQRELKVTA